MVQVKHSAKKQPLGSILIAALNWKTLIQVIIRWAVSGVPQTVPTERIARLISSQQSSAELYLSVQQFTSDAEIAKN